MSDKWFATSKEGLRLQAKERGAAYIFTELVVNCIDERFSGCTEIVVQVEPIPNRPAVNFKITDNSPRGYGDFLDHAYTLFAPSYKRSNAEQNGQFNFGCKLALSLCDEARILTTTGGVSFPSSGPFNKLRQKTESGSVFEGIMLMPRNELEKLNGLLHSLLLPEGVKLIFNGEVMPVREAFASFEVKLPTKLPNDEGVMTRTERKTTVNVYHTQDDETPQLYELGVPVVECDFRWHVSVGQKVLLNKDRDNVTPVYLRQLCTAIAENMTDLIDAEDAVKWGGVVLRDNNASFGAINKILDKSEGKNRVVRDMHDKDANNTAINSGATVIPGSRYSKEQWNNIRRAGTTPSAGTKFPSPKPYYDGGIPAEIIPHDQWSDGMIATAGYAEWLVREVFDLSLKVVMVKRMSGSSAAAWDRNDALPELHFAVHVLGKRWFDEWTPDMEELLIHEMAHQYVSDHHAKSGREGFFYDACCKVGRKMVSLALAHPDKMRELRSW